MQHDPALDLHRLLAEEPHVRALARAVCADPDDVVQQTWLLALRHGGGGIGEVRSWLSRIVRNVASNARRDEARRRAHERAAAADDLVPSSPELMLREERRRCLIAAVDRLPREQRTVVLLRFFDGLPPRRIAQRLGVPVTTVWSRLRNALQRLRADLEDEHGDRRAWLAPLLLVMTMTAKAKLGAAAVLVAAALAVLFCAQGPPPPAGGEAGPPLLAHRDALDREQQSADRAAPRAAQRALAPAAAAPTTGDLLVHLRHHDGTPGADVLVQALPASGDFRTFAPREHADRAGDARFAALPAGPWLLTAWPQTSHLAVDVRAGETTEVAFALEQGMAVRGTVVDASGVPVAGALVEFTPMATAFLDAQAVAVTATDGTFALRSCLPSCLLGARAQGHAASPLRFVSGRRGGSVEVRLQFEGAGGAVEGLVRDREGRPVAGAAVRAGAGRTNCIPGRDPSPPLPALVRTDAEGRFRAIGIAPGPQPVSVCAAGFAPWLGECEVTAHGTSVVHVLLEPGVTCAGIVVQADGAPVAGASVAVHDEEDEHPVRGAGRLSHLQTRSGADGAFTLRGLPAGGVELRAHTGGRLTTARVVGEPGETVACELRLEEGRALRGRVVDERGAPVPDVRISVSGARSLFAHVVTDAEGRFEVPQCPDTVSLVVSGAVEPERFPAVSPRQGEVELRARRMGEGDARVRGVVVGPDGAPLVDASVIAAERSRSTSTGADGSFELAELQAGTWLLLVHAAQLPWQWVECEVFAGATLDVGRLQLQRGGTASFAVAGEDSRVRITVFDGAGRGACETRRDGRLHRTGPLAPGTYQGRLSGEGVAMQAVPFTVRAGEETAVRVQPARAVRQRVEFTLPHGDVERVQVEVLQDGAVIGSRSVRVTPARPCATDLWLAPGRHALRATAGPFAGRAEVEIGTARPGAVRLDLR